MAAKKKKRRGVTKAKTEVTKRATSGARKVKAKAPRSESGKPSRAGSVRKSKPVASPKGGRTRSKKVTKKAPKKPGKLSSAPTKRERAQKKVSPPRSIRPVSSHPRKGKKRKPKASPKTRKTRFASRVHSTKPRKVPEALRAKKPSKKAAPAASGALPRAKLERAKKTRAPKGAGPKPAPGPREAKKLRKEIPTDVLEAFEDLGGEGFQWAANRDRTADAMYRVPADEFLDWSETMMGTIRGLPRSCLVYTRVIIEPDKQLARYLKTTGLNSFEMAPRYPNQFPYLQLVTVEAMAKIEANGWKPKVVEVVVTWGRKNAKP